MIRLHAKSDVDLRSLGQKMRSMATKVGEEAVREIGNTVKRNLSVGYTSAPEGESEKWTWLSDEYWRSIGKPTPAEHSGMRMTDDLMKSIKTDMIDDTTFELLIDSEYAAVLEYGGGNNIPPRPYAEPAIHFFEQSGAIEDIIDKHLGDVFK